MYTIVRHVFRQYLQKPHKSVLIVGIDNAGKTSILNQCKRFRGLTALDMVFPTMGQNSEDILYKKFTFVFVDLAGRRELRGTMWNHYFMDADAVVYVVDAADRERLDESREELDRLLVAGELGGAPMLICANKQDDPAAIKPADLWEEWELEDKMGARASKVIGTCGITGFQGGKKLLGIHEMFSWLFKSFKGDFYYAARFRALRLRREQEEEEAAEVT